MNLKKAVLIGALLLQVFLAVSPMLPRTASYWHADDPVAFYSRLALMVGLQFTLLTSAITLTSYQSSSDLQKVAEELRAKFPPVLVELLTGGAFYSQFRAACERAAHTVRIAYFAPYPPTDVSNRDTFHYYSEMLALMKRRHEVTFKRLIRQSPKNDAWIVDLLLTLEHKGNNDIALLKDAPATEEMPLAMSVQVVDEADAWIVAVAKHETEGSYRDLHIQSTEAAMALTEYYERIWLKATKLLDRGRITDAGRELIRRVEAKSES